jgi:REP element-mobilizing transposase RayT
MGTTINQKKRRSIRLYGYDYSQPGNYFVTICTYQKGNLLGTIVGGKPVLSAAGEAVRSCWFDLAQRFPFVELVEFIAMPNHIHAILGLRRPSRATPRGAASSAPIAEEPLLRYPSVGEILRAFKSISAITVNRIRGRRSEHVWQRNFYEHIIRSPKEFEQIQKYIHENPMNWDRDPENIVGALLAAPSKAE